MHVYMSKPETQQPKAIAQETQSLNRGPKPPKLTSLSRYSEDLEPKPATTKTGADRSYPNWTDMEVQRRRKESVEKKILVAEAGGRKRPVEFSLSGILPGAQRGRIRAQRLPRL